MWSWFDGWTPLPRVGLSEADAVASGGAARQGDGTTLPPVAWDHLPGVSALVELMMSGGKRVGQLRRRRRRVVVWWWRRRGRASGVAGWRASPVSAPTRRSLNVSFRIRSARRILRRPGRWCQLLATDHPESLRGLPQDAGPGIDRGVESPRASGPPGAGRSTDELVVSFQASKVFPVGPGGHEAGATPSLSAR